MTEIHHTGLTVSDLDRSVEFYSSAFGCREVLRHTLSGADLERAVGVPGAVIEGAMLTAGNTVVELLQYRSANGKPFALGNNDVGSAHLCFTVADIDAAYQRIVAQGAVPLGTPSDPADEGPGSGARFAYLLDPDGITVELLQPGPAITHGALGVGAGLGEQ